VTDRVVVGGARDVRGSLDTPVDADACVVACPPHPRMGGSRQDTRLTAIADALVERGVACLRFDYGEWDGGRGERADATAACDWARERYDRIGLVGYSFGAAVALSVAANRTDLAAVSVLAAPAGVGGTGHDGENTGDDEADGDAVTAVDAVEAPLQVVYGERDDTVSWRPVVAAAREAGATVEGVAADHHFVGQSGTVGDTVGAFLADALA